MTPGGASVLCSALSCNSQAADAQQPGSWHTQRGGSCASAPPSVASRHDGGMSSLRGDMYSYTFNVFVVFTNTFYLPDLRHR
jgi:hypothetical protein